MLKEFDVDGVWDEKETTALRAFYGTTHRPTVNNFADTAVGSSATVNVDSAIGLSDNQQDALLNFLSLYNLTVSDSDSTNHNGSWEEIAVFNRDNSGSQDTVRAALFGGGTQVNSLIQRVWIGDGKSKNSAAADNNSLPKINDVLKRLNITHDQRDGHEHHFHVDFQTPTRVPIENNAPLTVDTNVISDQEQLVNELTASLNLTKEEIMILLPETPANIQATSPTVVAVQSSASSSAAKQFAIGACLPVLHRLQSSDQGESLSPHVLFRSYFFHYAKSETLEGGIPEYFEPTIEVISAPKHGVIVEKSEPNKRHPEKVDRWTEYVPNIGFDGEDKAVLKVTYKGKSVNVLYILRVSDISGGNTSMEAACPDHLNSWKISSLPTGTNPTTITYSNLLNSALSTFKGFTDLPAGEVEINRV